jgi:hypothetical protein
MKKQIKSFLSVILALMFTLSAFSIIISADQTETAENTVLDEIINTAETGDSETTIAEYVVYKEKVSYSVGNENISVDINQILKDKEIEFEIEAAEDGLYNFGLSYKGLGDATGNLNFGLKIDGEYPFAEAEKFNLFRIFRDAEGGNRVD